MAGNTIGKVLALTSFGESHGPALGGVLDGYPAGITVDTLFIQSELDRRRPGTGRHTTARNEADSLEILSGVFEGRSTGMPIAFIIRNTDQRSRDYSTVRDVFRPGHADYSWWMKYHNVDYRGGGRSSGRETAVRVAAGALAKLLLRRSGISIQGIIRAVGNVSDPSHDFPLHPSRLVPASSEQLEAAYLDEIERARMDQDSVGGIVECRITGVPAGLGEPVFDRLGADLAKAVFSIGAVRGFEFGRGFACAELRGSQMNDKLEMRDGKVSFLSNNSGGIQGGISNGEDIVFRVAFRPTPSISQEQKTVTRAGSDIMITITGRHDPCIVPRAVVVVESMAALTVADHLLRAGCYE